MAGIFGILGLDDNDRSFVNTIGQDVVYEASQQLMARYNADLMAAMSVFIEEQTEGFKERYKLPGGGRLQERGGLASSGAVKASGYYDVAYPLRDYGAQIGGDRVSLAYMRINEYQNHLDTIMLQNTNTVRWAILHALLDDQAGSAETFVDPIHGSLSVVPLANGDSVVYPPVLGSESEATEDHYAETGYTVANMSDTNNPFVTGKNELEEHFGAPLGGSDIVAFCNTDVIAKAEDLTDYDAVPDRYVRPGQDTDVPFGLPSVPGVIRGRTNGVWVAEWRWIPATYILFLHLGAPPPLKMRVDPADTGLPRGLTLVAEDEMYPLQTAHYVNRFGLGCGNRLSACVIEVAADGSYTIPASYT